MKNQLRQKSKNIRKNLDCKISSEKITQIIQKWEIFQKSENIMIYHPINNEIDLLSLCKNCKKKFYLPKMENDDIKPALFRPNEGLITGKYSIKEPQSENLKDLTDLDLIFVPALCADRRGFRIGYGKGCYDRFLPKLPAKTITAIVTYDELLFEELPAEEFDKKSDFVITPSGIFS